MKLGGRCDESFLFDVDVNNMDTFYFKTIRISERILLAFLVLHIHCSSDDMLCMGIQVISLLI